MSTPLRTYIPDEEWESLAPHFNYLVVTSSDEYADPDPWEYNHHEEAIAAFYQRWVTYPNPEGGEAIMAYMFRERELGKHYLQIKEPRAKMIGVFHAANGLLCDTYSPEFDRKGGHELANLMMDYAHQEFNIFSSFARKKLENDFNGYGVSLVPERKTAAYYDEVYLPAVCSAADAPKTVAYDVYNLMLVECPVPLHSRVDWKLVFTRNLRIFQESIVNGWASPLRLVLALMSFGEDEEIPPQLANAPIKPPCNFDRLRAVSLLWRNRLNESMDLWVK